MSYIDEEDCKVKVLHHLTTSDDHKHQKEADLIQETHAALIVPDTQDEDPPAGMTNPLDKAVEPEQTSNAPGSPAKKRKVEGDGTSAGSKGAASSGQAAPTVDFDDMHPLASMAARAGVKRLDEDLEQEVTRAGLLLVFKCCSR